MTQDIIVSVAVGFNSERVQYWIEGTKGFEFKFSQLAEKLVQLRSGTKQNDTPIT